MKRLIAVVAVAALGGCAVAPPGPANYGSRVSQQPSDPRQWHVVSVTPVQRSDTAMASTASDAGTPSAPVTTRPTEYTSEPIVVRQPMYVQQPVYVAPPLYVEQPYYYAPYSPALTLGLGVLIGSAWHHGRGYGGWRGGYRHR